MSRYHHFRAFLSLFAATLILTGCGVKRNVEVRDVMAQFRNQERIEFLTLEPGGEVLINIDASSDPITFDEKPSIHGVLIVDSRVIESQADRDALLDAFEHTVLTYDPGEPTACYNPHHALRLPDDPEAYMSICFECTGARYQYDDKSGFIMFTDVDGSLEAVFDKYVQELGMATSEI